MHATCNCVNQQNFHMPQKKMSRTHKSVHYRIISTPTQTRTYMVYMAIFLVNLSQLVGPIILFSYSTHSILVHHIMGDQNISHPSSHHALRGYPLNPINIVFKSEPPEINFPDHQASPISVPAVQRANNINTNTTFYSTLTCCQWVNRNNWQHQPPLPPLQLQQQYNHLCFKDHGSCLVFCLHLFQNGIFANA